MSGTVPLLVDVATCIKMEKSLVHSLHQLTILGKNFMMITNIPLKVYSIDDGSELMQVL